MYVFIIICVCVFLYTVTVILHLYICKDMCLFNVYLMCSRATHTHILTHTCTHAHTHTHKRCLVKQRDRLARPGILVN